jgi:hypothetical protein
MSDLPTRFLTKEWVAYNDEDGDEVLSFINQTVLKYSRTSIFDLFAHFFHSIIIIWKRKKLLGRCQLYK